MDSTETPDGSGLGGLLQRELLRKLNLPPDNPPDWFPGRRSLPTCDSNANRNDPGTTSATVQPPQQAKQEPEVVELFDEDDLLLASAVENYENLAAPSGPGESPLLPASIFFIFYRY